MGTLFCETFYISSTRFYQLFHCLKKIAAVIFKVNVYDSCCKSCHDRCPKKNSKSYHKVSSKVLLIPRCIFSGESNDDLWPYKANIKNWTLILKCHRHLKRVFSIWIYWLIGLWNEQNINNILLPINHHVSENKMLTKTIFWEWSRKRSVYTWYW